jgi:hypothetical protein
MVQRHENKKEKQLINSFWPASSISSVLKMA